MIEISFAASTKLKMKLSDKRFWKMFTLLTLILFAQQWLWNVQASAGLKLPNGYLLLSIFSVSVAGFHWFLQRWSGGSAQVFVRSYMVSTVLKFMFYMALFGIFLYRFPQNRAGFVIHFLLYYVVFTLLELNFLFAEMKAKK